MLRRLVVNTVVVVAAASTISRFEPVAQSQPPRGEVYEQGTDGGPYSFEDDECGFTFHVEGRSRSRYVIYTVPGSSGQAYLLHNWYSYREVVTNPDTGKKMSISGRAHFREVKATHVEGDSWEVVAVESGTPFAVRNASGRMVLADVGVLITRSVQDTLGDGRPSSEELEHEVLKTVGHLPSLADDFDFCALVSRLTG